MNKNLIKEGSINELVLERSIKAFEAGADGVISSPHEAHMIKGLSEAQGKLIVTPGIRPLGFNSEDQKRVMTPDAALANGADHIVIGRPVIKAKNPRLEIKKILKTIETIK